MEHGFQFFRHFWHRFREVIVFAPNLFQIEQFDRSVRETLDPLVSPARSAADGDTNAPHNIPLYLLGFLH